MKSYSNNVQRKQDKIKEYDMSGFIVILLCITIILLGVGIYLHFTKTFNMTRFWGIYGLIIGIPGLILGGFNLVYLGLTAAGGIWLAFANINDKPLAALVAFSIVGVLGLISYFINKSK